MSFYETIDTVSMTAGGTIAIWDVVMVDVANDVQVLSCNDVDATGIMGIATMSAVSGDTIGIAFSGVTKARCGATVTLGGAVGSNTSGAVINLAASSRAVGIALTAGVNNDVIPILISIGEKKA